METMVHCHQCYLTTAIAKHKCRLLGQLMCCKYACIVRSFDRALNMYYVMNGGLETSTCIL